MREYFITYWVNSINGLQKVRFGRASSLIKCGGSATGRLPSARVSVARRPETGCAAGVRMSLFIPLKRLAGTALMRYHCTRQYPENVRHHVSAANIRLTKAPIAVAIDRPRGVSAVDLALAGILSLILLLLISLVIVG